MGLVLGFFAICFPFFPLNFTVSDVWEFRVVISPSPLAPESHLGVSLTLPGHLRVRSPDVLCS